MKKRRTKRRQSVLLLTIFLLLVLAGAWFVRSTMIVPVEIDVEQAYKKYQDGVYFLDVRTQEEWNEYHVEGAHLIPLDELQNRLSELPVDQEIVVVCRSGNRSLQGRNVLVEAGFSQVSSMAGGMNDWRRAGYEWVAGQ
jgi:rhodanese-related sulfurtransferase